MGDTGFFFLFRVLFVFKVETVYFNSKQYYFYKK